MKKTPLYSLQLAAGARMGPFGGWEMPISYGSILEEHLCCRQSAALFDISHMGEFIFKGDIQLSGMEAAITQPLGRMVPGSCKYGFILNQNGGIVDDLIVLKLAEDELMLVVNAAPAAGDLKILRSRLVSGELSDISDRTAKIDIQGPLSRLIMMETLGINLDLRYFRFGRYEWEGEELLIARAGYTGELGYEIYCSPARAVGIWSRLLEDKRVVPAGLGARDILRLEIGYSLYGQDIDETTTPAEAGLGAFIRLDHEFVGQAALLQEKGKGLKRNRVAFRTASRRCPRSGYLIYSEEREVGRVSSGCFSPMLSCGIGLGYVETGCEKVGSDLVIGDGKSMRLDAKIVTLPFYTGGSVRA